MKTGLRRQLTLGLILTGGCTGLGQSAAAGSPASSTEHNLQITVRVVDHVHMPPDRLAEAERVATPILRQAGVQAVWLDCSITDATGQSLPACDRPLEPTDLILSFVEEIQSLNPKVSENTLGFALIPDAGGQGNRAYISNRQVLNTARRRETSPEMILGLAAAHEIGHLLMGSGEHSSSGLMRAGWNTSDIERATKNDLRFTNDQIRQVNAGTRARITQQNVLPAEAALSR